MDRLHHSTRNEPARDRPARWRGIVQPYFGDLRVDSLCEQPLDAELDVYAVGPLRLYRLQAPPHRVRRPDHRELPIDGSFKLVLLLQGRSEIRMRERAFTLRPGDWSLYDPRVPYEISNFEPTTKLIAQVPRALLSARDVPALHTSEPAGDGPLALASVFGAFLRCLADQLPRLPNGAGQPVSDTLLGLLASTLAGREATDAPAALPEVMKQRVKQYVKSALKACSLSCSDMAAP